MLQYDLQMRGIAAINQTISTLCALNPGGLADGDLLVSATARDKEIVSNCLIHCDFAMHYDHGEIHVFWETSGLTNYLNEGLYGAYTTKWQMIELGEPGIISIVDKQADTKITIDYKA